MPIHTTIATGRAGEGRLAPPVLPAHHRLDRLVSLGWLVTIMLRVALGTFGYCRPGGLCRWEPARSSPAAATRGPLPDGGAAGVGATLGMGLWNLLLKRAFGIAQPLTPPMPFECVAGRVAH